MIFAPAPDTDRAAVHRTQSSVRLHGRHRLERVDRGGHGSPDRHAVGVLRPVALTELACWRSHVCAIRQVSAGPDMTPTIFEDDAILRPELPIVLDALEDCPVPFDLVSLGRRKAERPLIAPHPLARSMGRVAYSEYGAYGVITRRQSHGPHGPHAPASRYGVDVLLGSWDQDEPAVDHDPLISRPRPCDCRVDHAFAESPIAWKWACSSGSGSGISSEGQSAIFQTDPLPKLGVSLAHDVSGLGSTRVVRFGVSARRDRDEPDDVATGTQDADLSRVLGHWQARRLSALEAAEPGDEPELTPLTTL